MDKSALFAKFEKILKMTTKVKKSEIAQSLGVTESQLFEYLLEWNDQLSFQLDGDFITKDLVVEKARLELERLDAEARKPHDYHGTRLTKRDYEVMSELEQKIGTTIPNVEDEDEDWGLEDFWSDTFGFKTRENRVYALSLYRKKLTSLPDNLGQLSALEYLSLEDNKLTSLPDNIGELSALEYLFLNGNKLTSLPDNIGELSALETLSLEGNCLTSLPESIKDLDHLQFLDISQNSFVSLPESTESVLKKLKQQGCMIYR